MVARRPETWEWIFDASKKEHTFTYLYERDGEVEGYLCYHGGKREDTRLDEFVTLTPRAQQGMLGLLRRHEMQIDKFHWHAPPDDPFWSTFYHSDLDTKLVTKHMARIVDVQAALPYLHPGHGITGVLTLAVRDDAAPWNHKNWRVEIEAGNVVAAPTDAAAHVSIDIQMLAQAYLGTPTMAELRAAGQIQVHDEPSFRTLEHLFAGPPAWCCDGF
jgi:predicted acetyltransferase